MSTTRLEQARAIFEEALGRPPQDRAGLLEAACAGDDELRTEVESLLNHHGEAPDEFLQPPERPRESAVEAQPVDALIGQHVGQFRIKSLISAGGMGTVYLAEQPSLRRDVAVKVMRPGSYSPSVLRRFEHEALLLASLRHPNIAQVYEAGIHLDREGILGPAGANVPYFAMEYLPSAATITEYADRHELTVRQRLELFAQVCDAVEYGHRKGVIHRDLKPANILVADVGAVSDRDSSITPGPSRSETAPTMPPKVIDFGIARSTDADIALTTLQTQVGELMGTLQYMSPEQCDADPNDLDTRSDVYSLGVVLYEVLTGALPYDVSGTTIFRATQIIKTQEPRPASDARRELRGDVETIVATTLKKDREQRYQSAADLARDIRRFLNHEPIEARPPTRWARMIRWIARHPVRTSVAGTAVLTAAVVGLASQVAVWRYSSLPNGADRSPDGRQARLVSYFGKTLASWNSEKENGISFASFIHDAPARDGEGIAVVGFGKGAGSGFDGTLCAFDPDEPRTPLWARRIEAEDIACGPGEKRSYLPEQYGVHVGQVRDIFPESDGPEIVIVHNHGPYDPRVIRVYSAQGEVLYQAWHRGGVFSFYWMEAARLLVLAAEDAAESWDKRGYHHLKRDKPLALFALRPALGYLGHDWIKRGEHSAQDLVWCKYALPPEVSGAAMKLQVGESLVSPTDRTVMVDLLFEPEHSQQPASTSWEVDDQGRFIEKTSIQNDYYNLYREVLPDPNLFHLGDLPAILDPSAG